jgi:superfamily II DNA or RNA helicase
VSLLRDFTWKTKYDSDQVSLIREFYEPALSCAVRYDRTTGYFSAGALLLASRGIEGLVRNGGRMRLVVGCTLDAQEVDAISRGEDLQKAVELRLLTMPLQPGSDDERAALELLSWMVARGHLEIKVAVPCDYLRRPCPATGIFHEKAGIVEDKTGDRLAFNGSVNETAAAWGGYNWESFHVFTDWAGEAVRPHVDTEEQGFQRLWNDKARQCRVVDVPAAVRENLLQFLPANDQSPARLRDAPPEAKAPIGAPVGPQTVAVQDLRPLVWGIIRHAPALPNGGERVGEATAVITPWPHQVRTFGRLYSQWPPRLLIADEVGLGKTIEAGMLLRQAWLAGRLKRALILAPKAILTQWQIELREKFNLNWPIYDGQRLKWYPARALGSTVERKVSRSEWHQEPFVLASSQLMRRADRAKDLLEDAAPWDVVLLDEAHHARRKGAGLTKDRKPNQLLALMQSLRARTNGLLLLTATPMQVHPIEVWDLLNLLGLPDTWDESAFVSFFERAAAPNPSHADFEFMSSLFRRAEAWFGAADVETMARYVPGGSRLAVKKILGALRDVAQTERKHLETDRRRAAIRIMQAGSPVGRLVSRHTRELLREYYKAGKISTPIASRVVVDCFVPLSPAERSLYEQVEDYIATTYNQARADQRNAVGFVMTVYRRRLASSFAALRETLKGHLADMAQPGRAEGVNEEDLPDEGVRDEEMDVDEATELRLAALEVEEKGDIVSLLDHVQELPVDTKTGVLLRVLRDLREAGYGQVLVFTQFTDTMDFLREQIRGGFRVMCFSGRGGEVLGADGVWRRVTRDDVKRMFREGQADVLLSTDAGAEGLNFQFCGALVNYDMPWNPMRVEQRIGRIDRIGQRYEDIRIVNLHYEDTVETDVYRALKERIGLFTKFVGKLQPILSALPRGIASVSFVAPRDQRERDRAGLVSRIQGDVSSAEQAGFDLDSITQADLDEPARPEPLYDLAALDRVVRSPGLLPPGVEVKHLGIGQYQLSMPGMKEPLRVTTSAEFFDEHAESTELWSPGSPLFPELDTVATVDEVMAVGGRLDSVLAGGRRQGETG